MIQSEMAEISSSELFDLVYGDVAPVVGESDFQEMLSRMEQNHGGFDERAMLVLRQIAESGLNPYPWPPLRQLLCLLFEITIKSFDKGQTISHINGEPLSAWIERIKDHLSSFQYPPWTIQRICEILISPMERFRSVSIFIVSFSKLVFGIRERGARGPKFGLSCTEAPIGDPERPVFQVPFYDVPRLQATSPFIQPKAVLSTTVSHQIADGVATVRPDVLDQKH